MRRSERGRAWCSPPRARTWTSSVQVLAAPTMLNTARLQLHTARGSRRSKAGLMRQNEEDKRT